MSLISKLTSLFGSSQTTRSAQTPSDPRLEEVISQVIRPSNKFNLKSATQTITIFILEKDEHLDMLFNFIQSPFNLRTNNISPVSVIQLLASLHKVFQNPDLQYDLALKIKETKLLWLQEFLHGKENVVNSKEIDLNVPKRFETEVERDDNQFQGQVLATEGHEDRGVSQLELSKFAQTYHTYLQRLAANVDLYRAVGNNLYPYMSAKDYVEPKLMFLWHYKIQNILNTALPLLSAYDISIAEIQRLIWGDMQMFQRFLCNELQKVADLYATLPNSDTLSLYEIFTDTMKHSKIMDSFVTQCKVITTQLTYQGNVVLQPAPQVIIPPQILQDFLGFASRLKVLNQFTFKRSIKVPNKQNPCMGIPTHNPNVLIFQIFEKLRHLRSTSGNLTKIKEFREDSPADEFVPAEEIEERKLSQQASDEEEVVDKVVASSGSGSNNNLDGKLPKKRNVHIRGYSTFQHQ